jgi:hypothetical protein
MYLHHIRIFSRVIVKKCKVIITDCTYMIERRRYASAHIFIPSSGPEKAAEMAIHILYSDIFSQGHLDLSYFITLPKLKDTILSG